MTQSSMPRPGSLYDVYIFDLDGTIYLGNSPLPTVAYTISRLKDLGKRVVYLSNNPTHSCIEYAEKLTHLGIPTPAADIINSSVVMVNFLLQRMPGAKLFVIGESPLSDQLYRAGFIITDRASEVDAVIASFDRTFTYHKLQVAFDAICAGARFFATNADRYCPVPGGGEPDAAAIIAAIEACTGYSVEAVVGKPSSYMAEAILNITLARPEACLLTGDRLETDIKLGLDHGMDAALVLTGATNLSSLKSSEISPTYVLNNLCEILPEEYQNEPK